MSGLKGTTFKFHADNIPVGDWTSLRDFIRYLAQGIDRLEAIIDGTDTTGDDATATADADTEPTGEPE